MSSTNLSYLASGKSWGHLAGEETRKRDDERDQNTQAVKTSKILLGWWDGLKGQIENGSLDTLADQHHQACSRIGWKTGGRWHLTVNQISFVVEPNYYLKRFELVEIFHFLEEFSHVDTARGFAV